MWARQTLNSCGEIFIKCDLSYIRLGEELDDMWAICGQGKH